MADDSGIFKTASFQERLDFFSLRVLYWKWHADRAWGGDGVTKPLWNISKKKPQENIFLGSMLRLPVLRRGWMFWIWLFQKESPGKHSPYRRRVLVDVGAVGQVDEDGVHVLHVCDDDCQVGQSRQRLVFILILEKQKGQGGERKDFYQKSRIIQQHYVSCSCCWGRISEEWRQSSLFQATCWNYCPLHLPLS